MKLQEYVTQLCTFSLSKQFHKIKTYLFQYFGVIKLNSSSSSSEKKCAIHILSKIGDCHFT